MGEDKEGALGRQVGGNHYKNMAIQPFDFVHGNGIGFAEGSIIYYVARWKNKGGIEDLKKARHFLDMLIEAEAANAEMTAKTEANFANQRTQMTPHEVSNRIADFSWTKL
jgi:Protein of unknwon function (DUF3310)